jgi:hypothetical protein
MFSKLREKINFKVKQFKKAAFLALASYIYDKIANRKSDQKKKEYIENVEYEVEEKEK